MSVDATDFAWVLSLYGLLCLDVGFSGIRSANGTRAEIFKQRYYVRSVLRALAYAQGAALVLAVVGALIVGVAGVGVVSECARATRHLWVICLPYTIVIVGTLLLRAIPSVDCRSVQSLIVFGPLTLMRVPVAVSAIAYAVSRAPSSWALIYLLLGLVCALWCERRLHRDAVRVAELQRGVV